MENLKNELNIYQKIAILQDSIKVNKGNRNDFADFNYRTIQDIFSELKPLLKDLGLIINFGAGSLDGDKYTLEMRVIDINNPVNLENKIIETGEIYIDRTKSKMDLSQKVLSAKTFLKKSLLEDLLLISEDIDPDSHDCTNQNTNNTNQNTNSSSKSENTEEDKEKRQRNIIVKVLMLVTNNNVIEAQKLLLEITSFKAKDGKQIKGVDNTDKLKGARLNTVYQQLKGKYLTQFEQVTGKKS